MLYREQNFHNIRMKESRVRNKRNVRNFLEHYSTNTIVLLLKKMRVVLNLSYRNRKNAYKVLCEYKRRRPMLTDPLAARGLAQLLLFLLFLENGKVFIVQAAL